MINYDLRPAFSIDLSHCFSPSFKSYPNVTTTFKSQTWGFENSALA